MSPGPRRWTRVSPGCTTLISWWVNGVFVEERLVAGGMNRQAAQRRLLASQRAPIPDEDDPMMMAAAWSLNPSTLEDRHLPPSAGTVGRMATAKQSPGE